MKDWIVKLLGKAAEPAAASPDDGLDVYKSRPDVSVVMITVIGVDPALLDEVVTVTAGRLGRTGRLVYLTDCADFAVFRRHGVIFEYLPPLVEQRLHEAAMPWQAYMRERWALLLAKWRPRQILTYGTNIEAFLAACPKGLGRDAPGPA